ncbi:MAG: GNAT family N-acetyltransferase [Bacteroidetes bacterium]|nr:GNAT family N-acetyltransferase [Bacteroidota bacterium]MBS1930338.1 GNAT family N-acetyltransferase [Bacteroidota bacterium]
MISPDLKLETDKVLLRPLQHLDIASFATLTNDPSLWNYFTLLLDEPAQLQQWVAIALKEREERKRIPFTIIEKSTGAICGSTSFGNISYPDKRIEIGWSWLGKQYQGTGINFHAKFSLLSYSFDVLNWERAEIKTDNLNERSKQALRKIGATEEGVLRSHMQMPKNRRRDSVYFSFIKNEWPQIKSSVFREIKTFKYHL